MSDPIKADGTGVRGVESIQQLNNNAVQAMNAGNFAEARALLRKAVLTGTDNVNVWLNLAVCCRALGDLTAASSAIEAALRINPRSFRALLMKGAITEATGDRRKTALLYGAAVGMVGAAEKLDPPTVEALQHARKVHAQYMDELTGFIQSELGPLKARGSTAEARRINAFVDISLGRRPNHRQEPVEFFYPGLPAIEFWEREEFPWLDGLEKEVPAIRKELDAVLCDDFRDFVPYVEYRDGLPIDQWKELNHSRKWGALHLMKYGAPVPENCDRCPATLAAIARSPQPVVNGRSPASMFSALQPRTRIPPHTGVANTRLVVHLPLIVPGGCGFRVGEEVRQWRTGEAWVFDDTIVHEAWNDSDLPRVILIFDIWNPRLSASERELVAGVMGAMDKFNGTKPTENL